MELIKENIEYEQLLGENSADTVVKNEFLIPDTHPDIGEILMVDVKLSIIGKEVMQDKVYLEGQIEYNVLYLAQEEDIMGIYNVNYNDRFSNYVDIKGAEHKMSCEAECYMEHMDCNIANERKIGLGGIIKAKSAVYKNYNFEIVKDISHSENVHMLKSPTTVDKIIGNVAGDLIVKAHLQVPMDKPQIGKVLKCDINIHKKDIKVSEGKIQATAFALVTILYRGKDGRDIEILKDDVYVNKEMELEGVDPSMDIFSDFKIGGMEYNVKEDDLGENRVIDMEALINLEAKVLCRQEIDTIDDIYSTLNSLEMVKMNYAMNVMQGQCSYEAIIKEDIEIANNLPKASSIIMSVGKVMVTDKKLVENKVLVDGILNVDILYRTLDDEKYVAKVSEEIPFNCAVEVPGSKIDMQYIAKVYLESLEAVVEANSIAVKAVVQVYARVNYMANKDFLVEVITSENIVPKKKASITIYAIQAGDTLWMIAKKYFTTIEDLIKINSMESPESIKIGQKIVIPGRAII